MGFSVSTRLADLLADEQARQVIERHFPLLAAQGADSPGAGFTLRTLASFPQAGITPQQLEACAAELALLEGDPWGPAPDLIPPRPRESGLPARRFAIFGPGAIARSIAAAVKATEGAGLHAVASRSMERARAFAQEFSIEKIHDSYEAACADESIDAVFICNIIPQHVETVRLALACGKHVVCEKPMAASARQAESLAQLACERNLFLMEAMWMRFNPNIRKAVSWIREGRIGEVATIRADFSFPNSGERKNSLDLGGGALLDMGIYPVSFALLAAGEDPETIESECLKSDTGVDACDTVRMTFPSGASALLTTAIDRQGDMKAVVTGSRGSITVDPPFHGTQGIRLQTPDGSETYRAPFRVNGYEYELEEVVACLDAGRTESAVMPVGETVRTLKVMDALRASWGLDFPFAPPG